MSQLTTTPDQPILPIHMARPRWRERAETLLATNDSITPTLLRVALGGVVLGAVALVHAPNGFYMNWSGAPQGEGYEFHLLALAMAASLVVTGGGRASLDRLLARCVAR